MKTISPTKSSSRSGRFKKKLVNEEALLLETPHILDKLAPFLKLLNKSQIHAADFAACYMIIYLSHRFPGSWPGARQKTLRKVDGIPWRELPFSFEKNVIERLEEISTLAEIFANFALKSTPSGVNRAILEWMSGQYKLELMFHIPKPFEVLTQQMNGHRCVTTLVTDKISSYILGERDSLSFTMHDLLHADHFYHNNQSFQGQLGFYGLLYKTFDYFDLKNKDFTDEFEYLISDMNAYAIHLLKCLKSAMIHYFNEDYFMNWIKDLNPPDGLYCLNTNLYRPESMDEKLLLWLDRFRQL